MSSTAEDYMRFCLMILNRGELDGVRLLKPDTVEMMTTNQIGDLECGFGALEFKFGSGFAVHPPTEGRQEEIGWGGIWGTVFRISKGGDWVAILLTQRSLDETYEPREIEFTRLVREAIQPPQPALDGCRD